MMPEGKTKTRNPLRCKGLRAFHLSKSWSLSWQNADFQQRGRFSRLQKHAKSCKNITKSAKTFRFRQKLLELLGGFPPTGINFDSATQLAKTKNYPAGWFPFWSCWADSNRRPHPYQDIFGVFYNNFRLFLAVFIPNNVVSRTFVKCSLRCFHACLWRNCGQPAICADSACANRIGSAPQITPQLLRKSI